MRRVYFTFYQRNEEYYYFIISNELMDLGNNGYVKKNKKQRER